jgi:hypothetical protein
MGFLSRRKFLTGIGAGAAGSAGLVVARSAATAQTKLPGHHRMHGGQMAGAVGRVNHARNGFNPTAILTDFDGGETSRDTAGGPCASTSSP